MVSAEEVSQKSRGNEMCSIHRASREAHVKYATRGGFVWSKDQRADKSRQVDKCRRSEFALNKKISEQRCDGCATRRVGQIPFAKKVPFCKGVVYAFLLFLIFKGKTAGCSGKRNRSVDV